MPDVSNTVRRCPACDWRTPCRPGTSEMCAHPDWLPPADVYIGDEPYDVDDETRTLVHVPCGTHLFGDGSIADHLCEVDDE